MTDVTNPETIRDAIATLLENALTGTGKPVQAVYNYEAADFSGQSPVIVVVSAGDDFERRTVGARFRGNVYLDVMSFVLYADSSWTPANCEDRLNLVKKEILDTLFDDANQFTSSRSIYTDGRSTISPANVGGADYRMEITPLRVQVFDD